MKWNNFPLEGKRKFVSYLKYCKWPETVELLFKIIQNSDVELKREAGISLSYLGQK